MSTVSVIIPVYNAQEYLESTLYSVLSQSFADIEIVCVDDGSTDGSAQILKRYQEQDKRVKVIDQVNSGGSAARNAGLKHSTGEYVVFLDSDDILSKDIIAHAYNRAENTEADIVFYNFARFIGRPTKMAVTNKKVPSGELLFFTKDTYPTRFFNDFAIITWNKLVKKSIITDNHLQFDTSLSHNHDVDFSVRLMLVAESYSWLDEVGYYYRSNQGGLTATKRSDPTNVLKILINLSKRIDVEYGALKPSFDNYVADMVAGTIVKYSNDENKVKEVFDFSHDVVIPEVGLGSEKAKNISESSGIFAIVESGDYEKLKTYLGSPRRKIRSSARRFYDTAQGILAKTTV